MTAPFVTRALQDGVLTLRFNRPEQRNAIARIEDCQQFAEAFEALHEQPEVRRPRRPTPATTTGAACNAWCAPSGTASGR